MPRFASKQRNVTGATVTEVAGGGATAMRNQFSETRAPAAATTAAASPLRQQQSLSLHSSTAVSPHTTSQRLPYHNHQQHGHGITRNQSPNCSFQSSNSLSSPARQQHSGTLLRTAALSPATTTTTTPTTSISTTSAVDRKTRSPGRSPFTPLLSALSPTRRRHHRNTSPSFLDEGTKSDTNVTSPSATPRVPYVRNRRTAISSEPVDDHVEDWEPPIHEKTAEEAQRLRVVVHDKLTLLCQQSSPENEEKIVRAMFKIKVDNNKTLIKQGDPGDNFYIVDHGTFDIFVTRPGAAAPQLVLQVGAGGSFGELALMYNAPRAATVVATSDGVVWGLDRKSFRQLLVKEGILKKQQHEALLNKVTIFKCMTTFEMGQLSEILQQQHVEAGEIVIKQGTRGDRFYIVESGELVCRMRGHDGHEMEVMRYSSGGFFGELALISDFGVRKASVIAAKSSTLLWIGKSTFDRVMGPIIDILRKNAHKYPSYAELVARSERRA